MSSMAEGSEGWGREDEPDLEPGDNGSPPAGDDAVEDDAGSSAQKTMEEELGIIDQAQDQVSEKTIEAADRDLPCTPPAQRAAPGSLDETTSIPDDSPSLNVSGATCAHG